MSSLGLLGLLLTVLLLQSGCQAHWNNDWDGPLDFKCHSDSYAITHIVSIHHNHYEDRRFEIGCTQVDSSSRPKSCYWTNFVNNYDQRIQFTCKSNHFINGMRSYHNNHYEDRLWKFHCCAIHKRPLQDCTLTGWTNSWDNRQDFSVPTGHVIKGVVSIHHNHYEDRLWEYLVCKLGKGEEARATTLLDLLSLISGAADSEEESKNDKVEELREVTLLDYLKPEPRADDSEEQSESVFREEDSRENTRLFFPMQESKEESQEEY